ncbi:putative nucleotidyltransferase substrate binding domain-containing protein [Williamsia sterculiae]|uniref:putative nucleotidyltransferase substrate binding domain-containing protein n=1 Tax=Williamsia sterculiae TaxID=1344003 RepID=UPI001F3EF5F4|nr:putative nucleotidyltransferase substrate binding domain-containing protein [Williamsia sterculiae]
MAVLLADHPPFDALSERELDRLLARAEVVDVPSGAEIFNGFTTPADDLRVVLSGQVELWNTQGYAPEGPDETLGPGGVFGYSSLLTGSMNGPLAIAVGPVRICRIPGGTARSLFSAPSGAEFLAKQLAVPRRRSPSNAGHGTVDELIHSAPVVGDSAMTVQQAASMMTDRKQDHVVIPAGDGTFGVLTDADIRSRVVAAGRDPFTPAREVMTHPAVTVYQRTPASEALTEILEHGLSCVPVLDPAGQLRGVVGPSDFIAAPAGPSMSLRRLVDRARTVEDLKQQARRMPYLVDDLVRRGQPSYEVTTVLSLVNDAVVRRALELVLDRHPELDGSELTWLSLGSNARREPVLSSDIDSAVSFDDSVDDDRIALYRGAFRQVDDVLRGCGLAIDVNGAIASMPLFARTHSQWRAAAQQWLNAPLDDKGMIFTSLLLDGRPIWGDRGLTAVGEVFSDLRSHSGTLRLLLAETLTSKARLRSMRDVLARRGGTFDIKAHALAPLVNIARWAALSVESTELDTRSRLMAGAGSPMLTEDNATTLVEVFDVLQKLRITYQVAQHERGEKPTDVLSMRRLSPLDRSLVAQAVREIAGVQRRMANLSQYAPVGD